MTPRELRSTNFVTGDLGEVSGSSVTLFFSLWLFVILAAIYLYLQRDPETPSLTTRTKPDIININNHGNQDRVSNHREYPPNSNSLPNLHEVNNTFLNRACSTSRVPHSISASTTSRPPAAKVAPNAQSAPTNYPTNKEIRSLRAA